MNAHTRNLAQRAVSLHALLAFCSLAPQVVSQERQQGRSAKQLVVRAVGTSTIGRLTIDRGSNDRVQVGDRVEMRPGSGLVLRGTVRSVDERTAVVELENRSVVVAPGSRGRIQIPADRFETRQRPERQRPERAGDPPSDPRSGDPGFIGPTLPDQDPSGANPEQGALPDHPGWEGRDQDFRPGQPLLAGAVRPKERPTFVTGRIYFSADLTRTQETDFAESFARAGLVLDIDNPFGGGGRFESALETHYRTEFDAEQGANFNLRQLSYTKGGDRFSRARVQVGRFLQNAFPEFGFVDGVEVSTRAGGGHSFGGSIGAQPVEDDNFNSVEDLQVSAHWLYSVDELNSMTFGVGFQKTWNNGNEDRDLIALKTHLRLDESWTADARALIDIYGSGDNIRSGAEFTEVVGSIGRSWDDGSSLRFGYRRLALPELRRREFLTVLPTELVNDAADRVFVDAQQVLESGNRLHGFAAAFTDEESTGGAGELGYEFGVGEGDSTLDLTLFGNGSEHVGQVGGRALYRSPTEFGSWNALYEASRVHETGFPDFATDFYQHRFRLSANRSFDSGWDLEGYTETVVFAEDISWSLGFFFQYRF